MANEAVATALPPQLFLDTTDALDQLAVRLTYAIGYDIDCMAEPGRRRDWHLESVAKRLAKIRLVGELHWLLFRAHFPSTRQDSFSVERAPL